MTKRIEKFIYLRKSNPNYSKKQLCQLANISECVIKRKLKHYVLRQDSWSEANSEISNETAEKQRLTLSTHAEKDYDETFEKNFQTVYLKNTKKIDEINRKVNENGINTNC